jgi:hypothetical protein
MALGLGRIQVAFQLISARSQLKILHEMVATTRSQPQTLKRIGISVTLKGPLRWASPTLDCARNVIDAHSIVTLEKIVYFQSLAPPKIECATFAQHLCAVVN